MRRKSNKEYLSECYTTHGERYNYSITRYINARTKVEIICPIHGVFSQNAREHTRGQGCHNEVHMQDGCTRQDYKRKKCIGGD